VIACMGGWCKLRDKCPHHTEAARLNPRERLCLPGQDGTRAIEAAAFRVIHINVFTGQPK